MSVRVQPAMAMSPDSEPPAANQRWAAVWRSRWGTEALDAGPLGAAAQRTSESFAAELLAAVAQPESGEGGEGMLLAFVEVARRSASVVAWPIGMMRPLPPLPRRMVIR